MSEEIPSRARAVQSVLDQVNTALRSTDAILAACIADLALDPTSESLRAEREEHSLQAARLRTERDDLQRALAIAMQSDGGAARVRLLAKAEEAGSETKKLAQKRIALAKELQTVVDAFVAKKKEFDKIDADCHDAYMRAIRPLVDRDRWMNSIHLLSGRAAVPLFDDLVGMVVKHAHQQPAIDGVRWKADMMADSIDRELSNASEGEADV